MVVIGRPRQIPFVDYGTKSKGRDKSNDNGNNNGNGRGKSNGAGWGELNLGTVRIFVC
jgi:hypothetical protein